MNLNFTLPAPPGLLVQLVCLLGDVERAQVRRIWMNDSSNAEKPDMHILAVHSVQGQHKSSLRRLDHRQRNQLRKRLLVELRSARDDQRRQTVLRCLLQQWDCPLRSLVESQISELRRLARASLYTDLQSKSTHPEVRLNRLGILFERRRTRDSRWVEQNTLQRSKRLDLLQGAV